MSVILLGHRGDPEHFPENTLDGFRSAVACGAHGVELDVHLTADGVPVVIHDETLDRTTPLHGPVDAHTWHELRDVLPRLEDVLDALRGHTVAVELKPSFDAAPRLAQQVLDISRDVWLLSFDHRHLGAVRHPHTVALIRKQEDLSLEENRVLEDCSAGTVGPWWEQITPEFCAAARAAGKSVLAWTVDGQMTAKALVDMGVTTLITNRPCPMAQYLGLHTDP